MQSVILELAPLLTAIGLVGRIGARITAELGTMVVSEQIDAFVDALCDLLAEHPPEAAAAPKA